MASPNGHAPNDNKKFYGDHDGGLLVSMHSFNYDDSSSNPAEVYGFILR